MLVMQAPSLAGSAARTASTDRAFHELNLSGLPNAAGVSLVGVRRGDEQFILDVTGSMVVARPNAAGAAALTGAGLLGTELELRDRTGAWFFLRFAASGTTTYWAAPPASVPTYTLTYTSATRPVSQPLCTAGVNEAVLFAGDRYDADRKTVTATGSATAGWFNIACAGTALAKLHLTRHTEASQIVRTTAIERQAMLKMFTADVCGDGSSFTVHGRPLLWADANHLTRFQRTAASLEAVWTDRGAVCMDTPRLPELAAEIAAHCGPLPRCTTQRGYVISANPQ
jgi:hypothetical protein